MVRICPTKGKHIINPIIDWEEDDVWEFIKAYNVPYCTLYDKGYKRLGCIGCPMSTNKKNELEAYPKYKQAYIRAFDPVRNEKMCPECRKTKKYPKYEPLIKPKPYRKPRKSKAFQIETEMRKQGKNYADWQKERTIAKYARVKI